MIFEVTYLNAKNELKKYNLSAESIRAAKSLAQVTHSSADIVAIVPKQTPETEKIEKLNIIEAVQRAVDSPGMVFCADDGSDNPKMIKSIAGTLVVKARNDECWYSSVFLAKDFSYEWVHWKG